MLSHADRQDWMHSLLGRIAKCGAMLTHPPGTRVSTQTTLYRLVFSVFLLSNLVLIFPVIKEENRRWAVAHPAHPIEEGRWKTLFADAPGLEKPDSALFRSETTRMDPGHRARVQAAIGKPFWIGMNLKPEELAASRLTHSDRLVLGYLSGVYQVWLNGNLRAKGSFHSTRAPLTLSLAESELTAREGLWIAVRIEHTENAITPDILSRQYGTGLYSQENGDSVTRALFFLNQTLPGAFFALDLLFAAFFFLFWNADRRKQDYAFMSFLVLVEAIIQLRQIDPVYRVWDQSVIWSLDVGFRVLEGAFGFFLGLSFARTRKEFFHYGIPAALGLALLTPLWIEDSAGKLAVGAFVASRMVPALFLLGAAACALQSFTLRTQGLSKSYPVRKRRLQLFALGLVGVALVHYGVTQNFGSPHHRTIYDRFLHLFFVAYLGGLLLSDYREQSRKLEALPVSLYHSLTHLPERLRGWIFTIDLKGSNRILKIGADLGRGGEYLEALREEMSIASEFHGGIITHRNGDELKVFFDEARVTGGKGGALAQVLQCVHEIERRLAYRIERFQSDGILPDGFQAHFRAGAAYGEIRPTWMEGLHAREPGWEEVGALHAFLVADRLMSLDLQVDPERKKSLLILERSDAETGLEASPHLRSQYTQLPLGAIRDKENRLYAAVALEPLTERVRAVA